MKSMNQRGVMRLDGGIQRQGGLRALRPCELWMDPPTILILCLTTHHVLEWNNSSRRRKGRDRDCV